MAPKYSVQKKIKKKKKRECNHEWMLPILTAIRGYPTVVTCEGRSVMTTRDDLVPLFSMISGSVRSRIAF